MATKKTNDKNDMVIIHLDRPRVLRYGHKALKHLTAIMEVDLANFNMDSFDMEDLEKILYCGLLSDARDNGETLKLDDMEDLLDHADSIVEITRKMGEAFNKSFGQGADSKN